MHRVCAEQHSPTELRPEHQPELQPQGAVARCLPSAGVNPSVERGMGRQRGLGDHEVGPRQHAGGHEEERYGEVHLSEEGAA